MRLSIVSLLVFIGLISCSSDSICGKWETESFFIDGANKQSQANFIEYERHAVYKFNENGRYEITNHCKKAPMEVPGLILREVGCYTFNPDNKKVTLVSDTVDLYVFAEDTTVTMPLASSKEFTVVNCSGDNLSLRLTFPGMIPNRKFSATRNMKKIN